VFRCTLQSGDSGVAFKNCKRMLSTQELRQKMAACDGTLVCRAANSPAILGMICFDISRKRHSDRDGVERDATAADGTEFEHRLHFGPFGVLPRAQGAGVGKALLARVYDLARAQQCRWADIEVVNHRTDSLAMYETRLGYHRVGTADFPAPERCTRPSHFILLRKELAP
jgi:GNAT superfamily N-acetyltransferase